jgi:hypothetical protein
MNQIKVQPIIIFIAYDGDIFVLFWKWLIYFILQMGTRAVSFFRSKSNTMIEVKK